MTIIAALSVPQHMEGETVSTVSLHTARSGRRSGEFLVIRHPDGRTEYRGADVAQIAPDGEFSDVAATVRRQHFQRQYGRIRDQFHGKAVALMTDTTNTPTLTGRALWDAVHQKTNAYDVLVHDGEAFACAMFDRIGSNGFAPLTGDLSGGEPCKRYDAKRKELYAYLDSHDVDPELRKLIDAIEDEVYDFSAATFNDGVRFATVTEQFRTGLLGLVNGNGGQDQ